jgi:hypothetical protein
MKTKAKKISDELRPEYIFDYSKAVRGKYYKRLLDEGANIVMLEPDVANAFVDSAAVNDALRSLLDLTRTTQRLTKKSSGRGIAAH